MNFPKIQINKASVSYVHHFLKEDIYCKIDFSKYLYNTIMTTIDDTFNLFLCTECKLYKQYEREIKK